MTDTLDEKVIREIGALRLELLRRDVILEQSAARIAALETENARLKAANRIASKAEAAPTVLPEPPGEGNAEQDQQAVKPKPHPTPLPIREGMYPDGSKRTTKSFDLARG